MGYVYVVTLDDKPVYVGKTVKEYLDRWIDHIKSALKDSKKPLHRAIIKYGLERMRCVPQLKCEDEDTLFEYEKFLIKELHTRIEEGGYNLTDGGEGTAGLVRTEEHNKKISQALKGKPTGPQSAEARRKNSESNKGRVKSEEECRNISEGLKGHTTSLVTREKIANTLRAKALAKRIEDNKLATRLDELEQKYLLITLPID